MRAEDEAEFRALSWPGPRCCGVRPSSCVATGITLRISCNPPIKLYGNWSRVRDRGGLDAYVRCGPLRCRG
jgi:hypothetical protein